MKPPVELVTRLFTGSESRPDQALSLFAYRLPGTMACAVSGGTLKTIKGLTI